MARSVYRDYDQRALDAEYNNREKVADSADWLSRYAIASAEARASLECRLDLAYGTHPGERLDVFPARSAPAPVHVFVHGGYWQRLDKSDASFVARALQPARPGYRTFLERFEAAYRAELRTFLGAVRDGLPSPCGGEDARSALRLALAAFSPPNRSSLSRIAQAQRTQGIIAGQGGSQAAWKPPPEATSHPTSVHPESRAAKAASS